MTLFALCLVHTLAFATPPSSEAVAELRAGLDAVFTRPALANSRVGICVRSLTDAADLYVRDADTTLIPASNMKIVTTATALHLLGPDYRFETSVFGALDAGGIVRGDLTLLGDGDPTLVPERVWYLANRAFYAGVREVSGDIVVDDTYFEGSRVANGFEQDHSTSAYMALTGALSVGFNVVLVHVSASPINGGAARVLVDPASDYAAVEGTVTTVSRGRTYLNVDVVPYNERSKVRISGRMHVGDPPRSYWRRIDNPPIFAGEVLRTILKQVGIKVRGKVKNGTLAVGTPRLATVTSVRLAEIVTDLNKNSNNFTAQQIALAFGAKRFGAPGTWDKAQATIEEFLTNEIGLARDSYAVRNASGLHDVNRMSPRQIVRVLDYMSKQAGLAPEFATSLAVAGGSGTLADRMRNTEAAHLLRAKTGTLSSASALSGYVTTKSGETVAFSIIVNDYRTPIAEVWTAQDRIGALLAGALLRPGAASSLASGPEANATGVEMAAP